MKEVILKSSALLSLNFGVMFVAGGINADRLWLSAIGYGLLGTFTIIIWEHKK